MKYVGKLFGQIGRTRGYFDTGKTSDDWDVLEARAERAEAELAAERARLDWLEDHGWITGEPCDRAAIDAAMKEETK